ELLDTVRAYVEATPTLLEAAIAAASKGGLLPQLQPLFDAATAYFHEPNDLIPDAKGLLGVLDDAYLSMALISAASQRSLEERGVPLIQFPQALIDAHANMRMLLGSVALQ